MSKGGELEYGKLEYGKDKKKGLLGKAKEMNIKRNIIIRRIRLGMTEETDEKDGCIRRIWLNEKDGWIRRIWLDE